MSRSSQSNGSNCPPSNPPPQNNPPPNSGNNCQNDPGDSQQGVLITADANVEVDANVGVGLFNGCDLATLQIGADIDADAHVGLGIG